MTTSTRWPAAHVEALAPDAASVTAGRRLAAGPGWSETGCEAGAVWGLAQGSGKTPYRTVVDLSGPAYSCSCPSRKFPCKHALGLLLRWSAGEVPEAGERPEYAATWLASRSERVERAAARAESRTGAAADSDAKAKRVEARAERVAAGLADLDRWLCDQVRSGVAGLPAQGYAAFEPPAARLVDAQAPGVAAWLRGLPAVTTSGPDWPGRLLEELALLRLLCRAHARLPELDAAEPALAASVRAHVGYPVAKESVLATPPVADRWSVHGLRDSLAGPSLTQRTVWLQGAESGWMATVLSFAPPGGLLDSSLTVGRAVRGGLHFYPGARPMRALVSEQSQEDGDAAAPQVVRVGGALAEVADALAADPWTRGVPVWVLGAPARRGSRWFLVDDLGDGLPLRTGSEDPWRLVAVCGGSVVPVLLDWSPAGWTPLSAAPDGWVVPL